MNPSVSVIIPVRDRPKELRRAVDSVLSQSFNDFELLVVNDGSPPKLYQDLEEQFASTTHRIFHLLPRGVSAARNFGVTKSHGKWLAFLDSDDLWFQEKLSSQVSFHQDNPGCLVSQTEEVWIRNGKRVNRKKHHILAQGSCFFECVKACTISPSSVMIHRSLFEQLGGFDENMRVCEDYDLWLRLSLDHEVGLISERLIEKHGGHKDQLSRSEPAIDRFRVFAMLKLLSQRDLKAENLNFLLKQLQFKAELLLLGARKSDAASAPFLAELALFVREASSISKKSSKELRSFTSEFLKNAGPCLLGGGCRELWKSNPSRSTSLGA